MESPWPLTHRLLDALHTAHAAPDEAAQALVHALACVTEDGDAPRARLHALLDLSLRAAEECARSRS